jgi:AraC-like DNA-binding protein
VAERVRVHLEEHCGEHVTLRTLSQAISVSQSTTKRAIRATWRSSFQCLLDYFRVRKMLRYLNHFPGSKQQTLALEGGWRSRNTLNAAVLRVTGAKLATVRRDSDSVLRIIGQIEWHISAEQRVVPAEGGSRRKLYG